MQGSALIVLHINYGVTTAMRCDTVMGIIILFSRRKSWGPHRISESHKACSWSQYWSKPKSTWFQSLDSFHWANASCLASHLLLLGFFFFFPCWKSYLFNKTVNSTSAGTVLPNSLEQVWHRTGPRADAQEMFSKCMKELFLKKLWLVKQKKIMTCKNKKP